jgi:hypothetical protein
VRRRSLFAALVGLAVLMAAVPAGASVRSDLAEVRRATARFHSVQAAEAAGYEAFLECFDSELGGMGQHYVDLGALDGTVEATHPEAMVYEVKRNGRLELVAVEYIVPATFVDPANPPELFGQDFHLNAALGVWVLHAWIWKANPSGMFADWNPRVGPCP